MEDLKTHLGEQEQMRKSILRKKKKRALQAAQDEEIYGGVDDAIEELRKAAPVAEPEVVVSPIQIEDTEDRDLSEVLFGAKSHGSKRQPSEGVVPYHVLVRNKDKFKR